MLTELEKYILIYSFFKLDVIQGKVYIYIYIYIVFDILLKHRQSIQTQTIYGTI